MRESYIGAEECGRCRFWHDPDGKFAECRRYAPAPRTLCTKKEKDTAQLCISSLWPDTHVSDWCGEFEPAPSGGPLQFVRLGTQA